jgi:hypothetical protein
VTARNGDTAARMASALRREPRPEAEPSVTRSAAPRVKPVRTTVDLEPSEHRAAKFLALEVDAPSLAALLRALLQIAREDPDLTARLRETLHLHQQ